MNNFAEQMQLTANDMLQFVDAVGVTLFVTIVSLFFGTIIGVILGVMRCSQNKVVRFAPLILIEPLRNSPLVVQLFLVYYGLPMVLHVILLDYFAAILTLSLNTAAFMAVNVQSAILAVPKGQWEAGLALGHSRTSTYIHIIARQAFRILLPQAITLYINQLMCSSLVSLLGIMDLARLGRFLTARTLKPFLIYGIVGLLYFVISYPLSRLAKRLEKRLAMNI